MRRVGDYGFTLVELLVVAPVMILTIIIMMTYLFNQYGQLTQEGASLRLTTDSQLLTLSIQDDVFFASSFDTTSNPILDDPHEPSGGWNYDTNPETLIISLPALTKSNRDPDRDPVYVDTVGCEAGTIEENSVLHNNVILFAQGTNLYKRTLTAPSNLATCGESYEKQTCPADEATEICPKDILLTDKLETFNIEYFDSNNQTVTNPEQATRVKVSVELKDRAFAEDIYGSSSITLKRLN
jgi:type II secretory pathway pseudopilin PulG